LSLVMLNHVLEAALAFMILLLAMSVAVIARVGPAPATATATTTAESNTGSEAMAPPPGRVMTAMPATALWPGPPSNGLRPPPAPVVRRSSWFAKIRYDGLHARGRMPRQRPPMPVGPPWGPAAQPPARQPQSSDRWS
jgi:hypothetical protein